MADLKAGDRLGVCEILSPLGHRKPSAPCRSRLAPGLGARETRRGDAGIRQGDARAVDERAPAAIGRLTGIAYALQNAELRSKVVEITKGSYEFGTEWLRTFDSSELPMPPEDLARVLHALIEGLVMQRILTPELCPDQVFYAAFAA